MTFPGLEAQIPGLVQVSILTVVIRLANRQQSRIWADAQHDDRPAKYRWHPLFNAAKYG